MNPVQSVNLRIPNGVAVSLHVQQQYLTVRCGRGQEMKVIQAIEAWHDAFKRLRDEEIQRAKDAKERTEAKIAADAQARVNAAIQIARKAVDAPKPADPKPRALRDETIAHLSQETDHEVANALKTEFATVALTGVPALDKLIGFIATLPADEQATLLYVASLPKPNLDTQIPLHDEGTYQVHSDVIDATPVQVIDFGPHDQPLDTPDLQVALPLES
jgi:hypothetical protein